MPSNEAHGGDSYRGWDYNVDRDRDYCHNNDHAYYSQQADNCPQPVDSYSQREDTYYPQSQQADERPSGRRELASAEKRKHRKSKDKKIQRKPKDKKEGSGRDKMVDQILENATPRILDILQTEIDRLETVDESHYQQDYTQAWGHSHWH